MLKPKHEKFCWNIVNGMNQTEAYMQAGYNCTKETARRNASELLTKADIVERIAQIRAELTERERIKADEIARELKEIAFFNPQALFDEDGNLIPIHKLPPNVAKVVANMKIQNVKSKGSDHIEYLKEIQLVPKIKALELLGLYVEMFKGKGAETPDISVVVNKIEQESEELARQALANMGKN